MSSVPARKPLAYPAKDNTKDTAMTANPNPKLQVTPTAIPEVLIIEPRLFGDIKHTQGKLVRVTAGSVFDVAVDMRKDSSTFGKWVGVELSAENHKQMWVPPGFAHGFLVLSETAEFLYKTTDYYDPSSEACLSWCDLTVGIEWPIPLGKQALLNAKDAAGLAWNQAQKF